MQRDRKLCKAKDCLIKTCSRHHCHIPKWYFKPIIWIDFPKEEGCTMYRSKDRWRDTYEDDWYLEDEDDIL